MHTHNGTLYPMLAVGAFMAMFWTGVVAGHALGLGCFSLFVTGILSACLGTIAVCELERRDRHGAAVESRQSVVSTATGTTTRSSAPGSRHRPTGAALAGAHGERC